MTISLLAKSAFFSIALFSAVATAGPGHDHGDEPAAASGVAQPRVAAHSDLFELVGVAEGKKMTIYLDRFATNEPVLQAKIEVELAQTAGSVALVAAAQADGTYTVSSEALTKPGTHAVSFTVTAGQEADLLVGQLQIGPLPETAVSAAKHGSGAHFHWEPLAGIAAGAAALLGLARFLIRRRKGLAVSRFSVVLLAVAFIGLAPVQPVTAGPGHDHGEAAPTSHAGAPKRMADGSVFLPKLSQRQLLLRTIVVDVSAAAQTIELLAKVSADPNAGGKVQPTQAGRIEATSRGFPYLGQAVRRGEVLGVVRTSISPIEKANQGAQAAELNSNLSLARKRLVRLEQLEGTVPQKDIDAARSEVQSLSQRAALVGPSVSTSERLVAPISGVISASSAVAGQVVDAREVVFEILDPTRLMIEATAFDYALLNKIASASLFVPNAANINQTTALRFSGADRALREGAIPLQFRIVGTAPTTLAIGQAVKVAVQTNQKTEGIAIPAAAIVKSPSNQDSVWVHTREEQFEVRFVRWQALDGARVLVLSGLKPKERLVVQGAALLNQVR